MARIPYWIGCLLLLTACGGSNQSEIEYDYKGSFYTEEGQCKSSANMSVNLDGNEVDVAFYCFVRACVEGQGKRSQGGYFEIDMGQQEFIRGRLSQDYVSGTWQLTINKRKCRGRFEAEHTSRY